MERGRTDYIIRSMRRDTAKAREQAASEVGIFEVQNISELMYLEEEIALLATIENPISELELGW